MIPFPPVILASTSPHRRLLMERLGLPFVALAPHVEEDVEPGEAPSARALRLAQAKARIWELPISYSGRTYEEGKKIGWKDGVAAFWHILRFNMFPPRNPSVRAQHRSPYDEPPFPRKK